MSAGLLIVGLLLLALALVLWPVPAEAEQAEPDAGSIDYRPELLAARSRTWG